MLISEAITVPRLSHHNLVAEPLMSLRHQGMLVMLQLMKGNQCLLQCTPDGAGPVMIGTSHHCHSHSSWQRTASNVARDSCRDNPQSKDISPALLTLSA